jgi:hypothetical protein
MSGSRPHQQDRRQDMTINFHNLGRNLMAVLATVLIGTSFIAAATGPALVTPTTNSDIVA